MKPVSCQFNGVQTFLLSLLVLALLFSPAAYGEANEAVIECLNRTNSTVVYQSDPRYATARLVFSKFYSNFPLAIAYPEDDDQVAAIAKCGSDHKIRISPRCGGHGNEGQSVNTGGITMDMSKMNKVSLSEDMTEAIIQGGNTAGRMAYELYTLSNGTRSIPIGQKPSVGFSGLLLGGGFGFGTRHLGLTCDQLISVKAVTADGTKISANATENEDFFWASCGGGGGNFGIVTEFTVRTYDTSQNITQFHYPYTFRKARAIPFLSFYQDWSLQMDSRATVNLEIESRKPASPGSAVEYLPPWVAEFEDKLQEILDEDDIGTINDIIENAASNGTFVEHVPYMTLSGYFFGTKEEFDAALIASGLNDTTLIVPSRFKTKSTSIVQAALDLSGWNTTSPESLLDNYDWERTYYKFKSFFLLEKLPDEALDIMLDMVYLSDSESLVFEFQSLGGPGSKFAEVEPTATAFSHRNARHCLMFKSVGTTITKGVSALGNMFSGWEKVGQYVPGQASYVNHLDADIWRYQDSYYGLIGFENNNTVINRPLNIDRLAAVSDAYDPSNTISSAVQSCCSPVLVTPVDESNSIEAGDEDSGGEIEGSTTTLSGAVVSGKTIGAAVVMGLVAILALF